MTAPITRLGGVLTSLVMLATVAAAFKDLLILELLAAALALNAVACFQLGRHRGG